MKENESKVFSSEDLFRNDLNAVNYKQSNKDF